MYLLLGLNLVFMFIALAAGSVGHVLISGFCVILLAGNLLIENWNAKDGVDSE